MIRTAVKEDIQAFLVKRSCQNVYKVRFRGFEVDEDQKNAPWMVASDWDVDIEKNASITW